MPHYILQANHASQPLYHSRNKELLTSLIESGTVYDCSVQLIAALDDPHSISGFLDKNKELSMAGAIKNIILARNGSKLMFGLPSKMILENIIMASSKLGFQLKLFDIDQRLVIFSDGSNIAISSTENGDGCEQNVTVILTEDFSS